MTSLHRFAAAATAFSLLLSATPAAAQGLGFALGLDAKNHLESDSGVSVKSDVNGKVKLYRDKKHGTGSTVSNKADAHAKVEAKMQVRLGEMIKHSIGKFVRFTKKVCGASSSDQTVVKACIEKAKVDLKASVNVIIDAAFKV